MIIRNLRINTLILFLTIAAALFTFCACSVDKKKSILAQQEEAVLAAQQQGEASAVQHQSGHSNVQEQGDIFNGDPETCTMCHVNVEIEIMKSKPKHAEVGVDCISCHGKSIAHIQDEINEMKPDRIATRDTMNSFCDNCHDSSSIHDEGMIARTACTDCHDAHATLIPGQ